MLNRKKLTVLPLAATLAVATAQVTKDPVLMTIDGAPVYKSEFEYVYHKNNSQSVEKKSLNEYVDMFVNFKLKVLDAKREGYDEKPQYLKEFESYRSQLASPYLVDSRAKGKLLEEACNRSSKRRAVSHILIMPSHKDSMGRTPKQLIDDIYTQLEKGADFAELAARHSDDYSRMRGGYIGYASVFSMVYPFENAMYDTPVGKYSKPFETRFGYHIVRVSDEQPNEFLLRASQISLNGMETEVYNRLDSIKHAVEKGADFNKLAARYTQNTFNGTRDGRLPWTRANSQTLPMDVVNAIFSLSKNGEMKIIQVPTGWCLLHRDRSNLDLPCDSLKDDFERQIQGSDRYAGVSDSYFANLRDRYSFSLDSAALFEFEPLTRLDQDITPIGTEFKKMNKALYRSDDETYPQSDFFGTFEYELRGYRAYKEGSLEEEIARKYKTLKNDSDFVLTTFDEYIDKIYRERAYKDLENSNPDFHNLLQEYSDGLLLFSISEKKIWDVGNRGSLFFEKYFQENRSRYRLDHEMFDGIVVTCKKEKTKRQIDKLYDQIGNQPVDTIFAIIKKEFAEDIKAKDVRIYHNMYDKGSNTAVDHFVYKTNDKYNAPKENPYVAVYGKMTTQPTKASQVRGQVVADYQKQIEDDWLKELHQKYVVKIDEDVLKTIK